MARPKEGKLYRQRKFVLVIWKMRFVEFWIESMIQVHEWRFKRISDIDW